MYMPLILSFFALFLGPILLFIAKKYNLQLKFLDSFVLFSVLGLVCLHILPESIIEGGWLAAIFALAGLFGPIIYSKAVKNKNCHIHRSILSLAFLGLIAHSLMDGLALFNCANYSHGASQIMLAFAVVLHRIPEGIAILRFTSKNGSYHFSIFTLFVVSVATAVGFFFGTTLVGVASEKTFMLFQALMAGLLLHIIFHRDHHKEAVELTTKLGSYGPSYILGAIFGVLLVLGVTVFEPLSHGNEHSNQTNAVAHAKTK